MNSATDHSDLVVLEPHYRIHEVSRITGHPPATIYYLMDQEKFPRPVKISERSVAWPESVLKEYISGYQSK